MKFIIYASTKKIANDVQSCHVKNLSHCVNSHQANFADVSIEGDMELGQQIRTLLKNIDIDWEEYLSKLTGDTIAHKIGNTVRHLFQWGKQTKDNLRQDVSDYLIEESRQLPHRLEVEEFLEQVSATRDAVERLQAKLSHVP
jgi:ubiquinone biosynthesis protein UbiJ